MGKSTILVVEDDEGLCALLETGLIEAGYVALSANSGAEALRIISSRADEIGLVVTDTIMREVSGIALERWMRQHLPGMPVIFMSGYIDHPFLANVPLQSRNVRFVQKPFTIQQLTETIQELLSGR